MGFSPESLPIIQTAWKIGFGCADKNDIQILGDLPDGSVGGNIDVKIVPAEQTPLVFSPVRIVKSILRQIFILVKSRQNH
jgi:hypothetical protein